MARVNNLTNFLNDVATAIKTKLGDNTSIPAAEFDSKIMEIETAGNYQNKSITITTNGNYNLLPDTGYDAMDQVSITVNVSGSSNLQDKTISITENGQQIVTADQNYDGLRQVLVNTNVSATGQICKIFDSVSEMQADGTKKENDLGIVYNTIPGPWTGFGTNVFYFPDTVVLENTITR